MHDRTNVEHSKLRALLATVLLSASIAAGCSSKSDSQSSTASDCGIAIDRFKELSIVDDAVITDPRSRNDIDGKWSFRHAVESAMPDGANPSEFVLGWLEDWISTAEVNGFQIDRNLESRTAQINALLICPWLHARPENNCDDACSTCAARELDLAKAPFRLLAIVNRTDLRVKPNVTSKAGESRLVFGFTRGPADDPSSAAAPMTLIFEYGLPETSSPADWVQRWHALGRHAAFDDDYKRELEALTESFVGRGVAPGRPNGSALSQVRTNESTFEWIWQLREFRLDGAGDLRVAPVTNTPGESLNGSTVLRDFVLSNNDAVKGDRAVLPTSLLAGSADEFLFRWNIPGVDEPTRAAFARETCNGCHAGENPTVDTAFHVSPFRSGIAKLSPFLNNPADQANDELSNRAHAMRELLCQ